MRILLSGFFTGVLFFCVSQAFAEETGLDTGRDIYFKHCKACHGVKGDGETFAANVLNPPPKNFTLEKSKQELTEERMIRSVIEGRKGTAMMPWELRLNSNEIRAVVIYIRLVLMGFKQKKNTDAHQ